MGGGYGMPVASGFDNPGPGFGGLPMSSSLPNGSDLWSMRKEAFQTGGNTMSLPLGMGLSGNPNMGMSPCGTVHWCLWSACVSDTDLRYTGNGAAEVHVGPCCVPSTICCPKAQ